LDAAPGLCTQLQDKRSSLVKEVCSIICEMARMLGDTFDPAAVKLIPTLLSLTFVTIRVISAAAWYDAIYKYTYICHNIHVYMYVWMFACVHIYMLPLLS
jgi:hypothetical protein